MSAMDGDTEDLVYTRHPSGHLIGHGVDSIVEVSSCNCAEL